MRGRPRGINPRNIEMVDRVIRSHPGREPWNQFDISVFTGLQIAIDRKDGVTTLSKALTPAAVDKVLASLSPDVLREYVEADRLAAPEPKSAKSKTPAWVQQCPIAVPRAPSGRAVAAMRASALERAQMVEDPIARKARIALIDLEFQHHMAKPTEKVIMLSLLHDNVESSTETMAKANERADKLEGQVQALLASMQTTQLLLQRWDLTGEPPATPRGRRPAAPATPAEPHIEH